MLSFTTSAVTVAYADSYCEGRGWNSWSGTVGDRTVALRRAQDHLAREYNGRWLEEWTDETAPEIVKMAIVEAAVAELATPGILSPVVTPGSAKVLTEVKGIKWEPLKLAGGASGMKPVLTHVVAMLSSVARPQSGDGGPVWVDRA